MPDIQDVEVDFKVHDGYVAFGAEVVRLSLLSPAVLGFFALLAGDVNAISTLVKPVFTWLIGSFVFMALAVLFGLGHRYFAIDYMSTLVEGRRNRASSSNDWRLPICTVLISLAPLCLFVGACLMFVAVGRVVGR